MYTVNSRIRYSEVDENQKLPLTGIINYLQDCSTFQSEDLGVGLDYLKRECRAWWLSSWQIAVDRYPVFGEKITVNTWACGFKGMYGYRNFTICDEKGVYLVRAYSVWFLFDTKAGRPVKVTSGDIETYGMEEPLDMHVTAGKIPVPDAYVEMEPMIVERHHLDTNHHVNNAQYVEMAREVLPYGLHVTELRVEYKKAAVLNDVVIPRVSEQEDSFTVSLCDEADGVYAVVWLKKE